MFPVVIAFLAGAIRRMISFHTMGRGERLIPSKMVALAAMRHGGSGAVALFTLMIFCLLQPTARAADSYWTNATGIFTDVNSWVGGVPGAADNANFTNNATYTVNWTANATNANALFNGGTNTVTLGLGSSAWMVTNSFVVGQTAGLTGSVSQTAGSLVVTNSGGNATLLVGQSGRGTYVLNGGTVTADQLWVTDTNSVFTFTSGTLNTLHGSSNISTGNISIGTGGGLTATWNITGGTNLTKSTVGGITYVGDAGGSTTKGAVTVSGAGTVWTNVGAVRLGAFSGNDKITITNGGQFYNSGDVLMGQGTGAGNTNNQVVVTGSGSLWSVGGTTFNVGNNGALSMITVSAGGHLNQVSASGQILLGSGVASSSNTVWVTGAGSLVECNALTLGNASVGNQIILQDSGEMWVRGANGAILGFSAGSSGSLLVDGGLLVATNGDSFVGRAGSGQMTTSNGLVRVQGLHVGYVAGGSGQLSLYGGTNALNGVLSVGYDANNATGSVLVSDAGFLEIQSNGAVTLGTAAGGAGVVTNRNGGTIQFDVNPTIGLSNGIFVVTNATIAFKGLAGANVGEVTNNSTKVTVQAGSRLRLDASTNASGLAVFNVGGAGNYAQLALTGSNAMWQSAGLNMGSGGSLAVTGAVGATVGGVVTNQGMVQIINSTVTWQSNVVTYGSYLSDPSTNIFINTLTVMPSGSLSGSNGDLFVFSRDFINQSTNRTQFDLSRSALLFTNGAGVTVHTLNLTNSGAVDMGAVGMNVAQLATNFSIGTLSISLSNNVTLTGLKSGAATNALYVGWLDLSAWNTNAGASLTNALFAALTLPDINLYYDAGDARNAYLQDASYALWGGGGLLIPIPEPSTFLIVLSGAALLVAIRRRS